MQIVYAKEPFPKSFSKSIFLAGPTPRSDNVLSWRPEAIRCLEEISFDGAVFVPESGSSKRSDNYDNQIEWEEEGLNMADCILFWVPRDLDTMPALTTNTEWGVWQDSGKVTFGSPENATRVRYQRYYAEKFLVPVSDSLNDLVLSSIKQIGDGAERTGGERYVPLYVWRTPHFQQWYQAQKTAGNRLDGARVVWTFRVGPKRNFVFFWALHVNVYIASENRNKTNEVVIARPDIVAIVMYRRGNTIDDTELILIREFRSPAATTDGFVHEIPGGSSFKPGGNPLELAIHECEEETGLAINASRIVRHETRQMVSTLSAHKVHLFSVEITEAELNWLRSQQGVAHGVVEDTEQTYVELTTLGEIKTNPNIDWSMLGMIMSVVS